MRACLRACVRACVRMSVCARVRAGVRACVRACVCAVKPSGLREKRHINKVSGLADTQTDRQAGRLT